MGEEEGLGFHSKVIKIPSESYSYDQSDWINYFDKFPDFKGNKERAGLLMEGFCDGASFAIEVAKEEGENAEQIPIVILTGSFEEIHYMCFLPSIKSIGIAKSYLEKLTKFDPNTKLTFIRADKEVFFIGTSLEYFQLCGVEECSHGIDAQLGKILPSLDPLSMTMAEYDLQEHEFKALQRQIIYAKKNGFTEEGTHVLSERLEAADDLRKTL